MSRHCREGIPGLGSDTEEDSTSESHHHHHVGRSLVRVPTSLKTFPFGPEKDTTRRLLEILEKSVDRLPPASEPSLLPTESCSPLAAASLSTVEKVDKEPEILHDSTENADTKSTHDTGGDHPADIIEMAKKEHKGGKGKKRSPQNYEATRDRKPAEGKNKKPLENKGDKNNRGGRGRPPPGPPGGSPPPGPSRGSPSGDSTDGKLKIHPKEKKLIYKYPLEKQEPDLDGYREVMEAVPVYYLNKCVIEVSKLFKFKLRQSEDSEVESKSYLRNNFSVFRYSKDTDVFEYYYNEYNKVFNKNFEKCEDMAVKIEGRNVVRKIALARLNFLSEMASKYPFVSNCIENEMEVAGQMIYSWGTFYESVLKELHLRMLYSACDHLYTILGTETPSIKFVREVGSMLWPIEKQHKLNNESINELDMLERFKIVPKLEGLLGIHHYKAIKIYKDGIDEIKSLIEKIKKYYKPINDTSYNPEQSTHEKDKFLWQVYTSMKKIEKDLVDNENISDVHNYFSKAVLYKFKLTDIREFYKVWLDTFNEATSKNKKEPQKED